MSLVLNFLMSCRQKPSVRGEPFKAYENLFPQSDRGTVNAYRKLGIVDLLSAEFRKQTVISADSKHAVSVADPENKQRILLCEFVSK